MPWRSALLLPISFSPSSASGPRIIIAVIAIIDIIITTITITITITIIMGFRTS
jgi:hypothetical protein